VAHRPISPTYYLSVYGALALTVLSGFAQIFILLAIPAGDPLRAAAVDTFSTTWKIGVGAFIGLLGGKIA
jgi:hypothetical protein